MKVETEGNVAILSIEDPYAQSTFIQGRQNPKMWASHPETYEMSQFLQNNTEYGQVFVKMNDAHIRVK